MKRKSVFGRKAQKNRQEHRFVIIRNVPGLIAIKGVDGMSTEEEVKEAKCACIADDAWACFQLRYYGHILTEDYDDHFDHEMCECPCHRERIEHGNEDDDAD